MRSLDIKSKFDGEEDAEVCLIVVDMIVVDITAEGDEDPVEA